MCTRTLCKVCFVFKENGQTWSASQLAASGVLKTKVLLKRESDNRIGVGLLVIVQENEKTNTNYFPGIVKQVQTITR